MQSLLPRTRNKLSARYAGPFQVLERIGDLAYRLKLPQEARIQDVFHVGVLKAIHGTPPQSPPALPPICHGRVLPEPERVLNSQLRCGHWHVLIKWVGLPQAEATWESVDDFRTAFPTFQLEDELFPEEGEMLCMAKSTTGNVVASQGTGSCIAHAVVSLIYLLFPIILSCRSVV
jgi:hypothetical protein